MRELTELKKLQAMEVEMLREVIRLCRNNGLTFFLHGGTALGAKKYGGFVPWDDDADIGMSRDDYEKFLVVAQNQLDKAYFLQTPDTDQNAPFVYAKIRKNGTEFVEWRVRDIDMHQGIFIDIFPYDNVPDDERERKRQFWNVQMLQRLFVYRQTPNISRKPETAMDFARSILRNMVCRFVKLIPKSWLLAMLQREMCRYNHLPTKMKACLPYPIYMNNYIACEDLYPLRNVAFEGLDLLAPNNLDAYLRNRYGDYSQLPPVESRNGHAPCLVRLDCDDRAANAGEPPAGREVKEGREEVKTNA